MDNPNQIFPFLPPGIEQDFFEMAEEDHPEDYLPPTAAELDGLPPPPVPFPQSWFLVNLDKRQYQWIPRFTLNLSIFGDYKSSRTPFPNYPKSAPFSAVDLMTRAGIRWPRRTLGDENVVGSLARMR
jgi:hypothetical protein